MVHSTEWSTGSRLFGLLTRFPPVPREPVVHSFEWSTGSRLFGAFDPVSALFPGASGPLGGVVHSTEWTTGSRLFGAFGLVSALSRGASGPLSKVVHWLTTFRTFDLVSALFQGASGPLDGVDHWLATLRQLCLSFRLSPSLFKPATCPFPSFSSTFYLELSCKKAPFRVFIYEDTFSHRKENAACDRRLGISTFISCLVSVLN